MRQELSDSPKRWTEFKIGDIIELFKNDDSIWAGLKFLKNRS